MIREKEYSFSTSYVFPLGCLFLASILMNINSFSLPLALFFSTFLLFAFSALWDFKGLFFSSAISSILILGMCPQVFRELPYFLFFAISFNTGLIIALLKKSWTQTKALNEEELVRLKAWESHYYVFRQECLEEIKHLKNAQEEMIYRDLQLQSLEHERLEDFLKEDEAQKVLIDLLVASREKCRHLEQEIELLEQIISIPLASQEKPKSTRKKKIKEETAQAMLF